MIYFFLLFFYFILYFFLDCMAVFFLICICSCENNEVFTLADFYHWWQETLNLNCWMYTENMEQCTHISCGGISYLFFRIIYSAYWSLRGYQIIKIYYFGGGGWGSFLASQDEKPPPHFFWWQPKIKQGRLKK